MNFFQDVLFGFLFVAIGVIIVVIARSANSKIKRENIDSEKNMEPNCFEIRKTKLSLFKGFGMIFIGVTMVALIIISRIGGNPTATGTTLFFTCTIFGLFIILGIGNALEYKYWKVDVRDEEIQHGNKTYTFDMITKAVIKEAHDSLGFGQVGKQELTLHFGDKDKITMHSTYIGYNVFVARLKLEEIEITPFTKAKRKE